ncbi:hypothetical protein G7Y89_g3840 [Cudoniella acicularis]|uniref:NAD-dependent epimerase/dehydratase domain-containing protein n=1 Tax=Cudoniella acicularis TaxID=354080 RepID=A0A8H4RQK8_9HELO|nr:hypothetical protein G7Y89_g3840 [Cudoniella acicularis]
MDDLIDSLIRDVESDYPTLDEGLEFAFFLRKQALESSDERAVFDSGETVYVKIVDDEGAEYIWDYTPSGGRCPSFYGRFCINSTIKMPKTLVTGANGFFAAHVIDQLIAEGHDVTGSVRSESKGQQILARHPEYKGHLDFVLVSDYTVSGTWDAAFHKTAFDYVIHTAAPLLDDPRNVDFDENFLAPSVKGHSASTYGKNVKAIAVTGSVNAITTGEDVATRVYNSQEWLPLSIEDARKDQNPYYSYCVAKAESEKAIWQYVKAEKPHYSVTVLLPALIFGPPIQPIFDLKKMNYSTDVFYSLFNGTYDVTPPTSFPSYIDARDLATAHIKSLTTPAVFNQRLVVGGLPYSSQLAVNALKNVHQLAGRLPKDNGEVTPVAQFGDVKEWNQKLNLQLRAPDQTFGDAARTVLELEKEFKA